jgi:hypothetical protein
VLRYLAQIPTTIQRSAIYTHAASKFINQNLNKRLNMRIIRGGYSMFHGDTEKHLGVIEER